MLALGPLPTDPAAWGAFLTGMASILAVLLTLRRSKHKADDNCNQRIEELKDAFKIGTHYELRDVSENRGKKAADG